MVIPEDLMSAATVIGACGVAFALRFMRAMSQGGIEIGFNSDVSQIITAQTVKGAARLMLETRNHPESEIDKVTTPLSLIHISEPTRLLSISYAVFCLKKKIYTVRRKVFVAL